MVSRNSDLVPPPPTLWVTDPDLLRGYGGKGNFWGGVGTVEDQMAQEAWLYCSSGPVPAGGRNPQQPFLVLGRPRLLQP